MARMRFVRTSRYPVPTSGVMIPRNHIGITTKRTGIGIAWNRFQSGIGSTAGIGSKGRINSMHGTGSSEESRANNDKSAISLN